MPRYIDADAFIKKLEADIKEFGEPNINIQPIAYGSVLGIESTLDLAKELPTADVVPKSEVDKWKEINEQLHKEMSEQMIKERKIERKLVAREIFAEIENTAKDAIQFCEKHLITPMLKETKIDCYKDLLGYIAELKKKYTEEQV